jgi:MHS family proline/betaine transporter-like MFS transporter
VSYTVFGGTAPLVSTWLITETGLLFAPAIYMVILATVVLLVVVALKMPETVKSNLLHAEDQIDQEGTQEVAR